jgi:hypothetical protein
MRIELNWYNSIMKKAFEQQLGRLHLKLQTINTHNATETAPNTLTTDTL